MENQHKKIAGYRDLTQEEIDLMNECKALSEQCGNLIERLEYLPDPEAVMARRDISSTDKRWVFIGKTDIQKGFMSIIRAIAKPTTF